MTFELHRLDVTHQGRTLRLALRDSAPGRDDLPVALGVHGIPESSRSWEAVAADLGDDVRLVVMDLPGFGESAKPRRFDYSLGSLAGWLGAAADAYLGTTCAVTLAVHDIGGPIGLAWALDHPERLRALLVLNTTVFIEHFKPPRPAVVAAVPVLGQRLVRRMLDVRTFGAAIQHAAGARLSREEIATLWQPYEDPDARRAAAAVWGSYPRSTGTIKSTRRGLRSLDVPAVVLFGVEDPYCTPASAHAFADRLPRARLELLEGIGHWTTHEAPVAVAASLRELSPR
ncbi:alpha/beta fold hydrolase [Nocardioides sp. R-C-SC26]|uniref:alpha/beta fold hydrolase n=1 Tax=Nocardioides sp. R-C-SC26 TaxID=2870414 RepID=UPI001E5D2C48|nr:alpha/beta hydrolase [Nocardioides sp. R-C-SC26]